MWVRAWDHFTHLISVFLYPSQVPGTEDAEATPATATAGGVVRDVNGRVWVKGQRKPRTRRMIRARSRGGVVAQQHQQQLLEDALAWDVALQDGVLTVYSPCPNMDPRMSVSMSFSGSVSRMGSVDGGSKACGDSPLWAVYPVSPPTPNNHTNNPPPSSLPPAAPAGTVSEGESGGGGGEDKEEESGGRVDGVKG